MRFKNFYDVKVTSETKTQNEMKFMKPGPEKDKFHKDAKAKAAAKIKDMEKKGQINYGRKESVDENQKAALAKKLSKVSQVTAKGKAAVTLPVAPWDKKNESVGTHHLDQHDNTDTDFIKLTKKHGVKHKAVGDGTKMTGHPNNIRKVLTVMPNHHPNDFKEAKLDDVDPDELKGKHKDRKDKDIDNDGDIDNSDKFLHRRRKAIAKASPTEDEPEGVSDSEKTAVMSKDNSIKKDKKMESRIRESLRSVVEKKSHGNMDNREDWDDKYKGKGAKDMKKDNEGPIDDTVHLSHADASAAGKTGPSAKPRNGGESIRGGDQKIKKAGTPMKDPAAPSMKQESEAMESHEVLANITNAYASMQEKSEQ
tara:strand:+ start:248 stop:1345 length:1098 start_codon:yes stop_codon:yes gene_type:complete